MTAAEVQGWRTWCAYPNTSDVLHSPWRTPALRGTAFATWARANKTAECQGDVHRARLPFGATLTNKHGMSGSPDVECLCGIGFFPHYDGLLHRYARFQELNTLSPRSRNFHDCAPLITVGRVSLSGRILGRGRKADRNLDTTELRAARACIEELWLPAEPTPDIDDLAKQFRRRYRVPVHIGFPARADLPTTAAVQELTRFRDAEVAELLSNGIHPGRA